MYFLKTLMLLAALVMAGPSIAANGLAPEARMRAAQAAESEALDYRDALLRAEDMASDPVWVRTGENIINVWGFPALKQQLTATARLLLTLESQGGLSFDGIRDMPFGLRIAGALKAHERDIGRAVRDVSNALYLASAEIRRETLTNLGIALDIARAEFQQAIDERDQQQLGETPHTNADFAIIGTWENCHGLIVAFSGSNGSYQGAYRTVPGLEPYGFSIGEVGYKYQATDVAGVYSGQILWKHTGGERPYWVNTTIRINGGVLRVGNGGLDCGTDFDRAYD